ncbi:MAG: tetratricopeptide repeat protein [Amphritea sp.]
MVRSAKFWIQMAVFQVFFGLVVFAITRDYYIDDAAPVSTLPKIVSQPKIEWPGGITKTDPAQFGSLASIPVSDDPAEISRQANEFFANKEYGKAAHLYEQLLLFAPDNVITYNNLGITLHYLGRSDEALGRLNEGVAVDPKNQRIWLTLGFVNSQSGDTEQARIALTTAVELDAESKVGQSAAEMLENLP